MRDSKHWPVRVLRGAYLTLLAAGAAAVAVAGLASPTVIIWH